MKKQSLLRKRYLVAGLLAIIMCISNVSNAQTTKKSTVDGYVKFSTTTLPMPLGRYIQLATPSASFKYSKPDANGNGTWTANFQFNILRHVPNLEYLTFTVEPQQWIDGQPNFRVKFKKDQNAVEKLANAINSKTTSKVNISWNGNYKDKVQLELNETIRLFKNTNVQFDNSTIYLEVPQSRISISGNHSQDIRIAEAATIYLYSDDGRNVHLKLSIQPLLTQGFRATVTATIRTQDGMFETSFLEKDLWMNQYISFPSDGKQYISPREMDRLLSQPVYIDLKIDQL